jgi:hypothetical protein
MSDEIDKACFQTALDLFVMTEAADSAQVRAYAEELAKIAREMVSEGLGRDAALVARAVHYVNQIHAIPPMRGRTDWFWEILSVVLEVARPNTGGVDGEALKFLDDMREGLETLKQGS